MRRLETKFIILSLAFFIGIIACKGYLLIASPSVADRTIEQVPFTSIKKQVPLENDIYTISPCKAEVDTALVPPSKKGNGDLGGEGAFRVENVNSMALCGNLPAYPESIRSKVSGLVKIEVHIDKLGKVICANAVDGNGLLLEASVEAAKQTRFKPYISRYNPDRSFYFSGFLIYQFKGESGVRLYKPEKRF